MLDIQCIYIAKLGCGPSLKSLRTFIMIRDDMTLCRCTYSSQSNTNPCHCFRHSLFQFLLSKKKNKQINKLTRTISYSNKALKSFHHNPPNNHALAITLLEFLVHALSIHTSQQIVNLQNMHVKTILYLQKILSIFWLSNTWFGY